MKIIYFGRPYSFTQVAALKRFGEKHEYVSSSTIMGTVEKTKLNPKSVGIIPIENTTGGIIYDSVDVLSSDLYLKSNLTILEELELSVKLFLLSKNIIKLSQVRKIYSHEYPLKRSQSWINTHLPRKVAIQPVMSTSDAAQRIQKEKYACAIASAEAAKHYNLKKVRQIRDNGKRNLTRFFVLGENGSSRKKGLKTTVIFSLKDRIGALCDALQPFKENSINLTRIISRPHEKKEWQYVFFIEMDGSLKEPRIQKALKELKSATISINTLGSYSLRKV